MEGLDIQGPEASSLTFMHIAPSLFLSRHLVLYDVYLSIPIDIF